MENLTVIFGLNSKLCCFFSVGKEGSDSGHVVGERSKSRVRRSHLTRQSSGPRFPSGRNRQESGGHRGQQQEFE